MGAFPGMIVSFENRPVKEIDPVRVDNASETTTGAVSM
jgi:hypothetical protein